MLINSSNIQKENLNIKSSTELLNDRYIILEKIGDGLTSKVFKVLDTFSNGIKVAKIFDDNLFPIFAKEEKLLKIINNYNIKSIIRLYDSGIGPLSKDGNSEEKMFCILEYAAHGTLLDQILKTRNGFSEIVCKYILYEIIKIISSLYKKGICHRDIKLENILLVGDDYHLKLCDFGFSTKFLDKYNNKKSLNRKVGTKYYCAPEILENKIYDGEKVDIFSIGALLFILMTKRLAFEEAKSFTYIETESQKLYNLIKINLIDKYWKKIEKIYKITKLSPEFKKLFIKMVSYNPSERPCCDEIIDSEWMKEIKNADEDYMQEIRNKMINEMNIEKV